MAFLGLGGAKQAWQRRAGRAGHSLDIERHDGGDSSARAMTMTMVMAMATDGGDGLSDRYNEGIRSGAGDPNELNDLQRE